MEFLAQGDGTGEVIDGIVGIRVLASDVRTHVGVFFFRTNPFPGPDIDALSPSNPGVDRQHIFCRES